MTDEIPLVAIGDVIKIDWLLSDGTYQNLIGTVNQCSLSRKRKYGSYYKYSLTFDGSNESFETRLIHQKYEIIKKVRDKRKRIDICTGADLNRKTVSSESLQYIVAPMVGASELAFRLLCRKYGATLAYTPMMNSERFAVDSVYRDEEFQTVPEDRPLVAHFSANNPQTFLAAARHVEHLCDAIDLNLGCPQRVAHSGHFGSYLLGDEDRELVLNMVKTVSSGITIPLFVKIRLLDTVAETITLCKQLVQAGAALIAIHGRYRVNLVGRDGPGARDGPAHLDQIKEIRLAVPDVPIVTNGNVIDWNDVVNNVQLTGASGVMSAEGLLDNPAIFNGGVAVNKLQLAREYLDYVRKHPVKMKSVIFHLRRMCKDELVKYQLLDDCLGAATLSELEEVIGRATGFESMGNFVFDKDKEKRNKEALERKKREEGKRKEYEARMMRKAKREGKPLGFYIEQGSEPPAIEEVNRLKQLPQEQAFAVWKSKFSQHCYAFHFNGEKCARERTCSFLHADPRFVDGDAVVYG